MCRKFEFPSSIRMESLRDGVEIWDRRGHYDTKMTTVLRVLESTVSEVVERWWRYWYRTSGLFRVKVKS